MGHGEAERLGGVEVDDHLEFCRKLHREIARLGAAQNLVRWRWAGIVERVSHNVGEPRCSSRSACSIGEIAVSLADS
jgi:hypothetical protein